MANYKSSNVDATLEIAFVDGEKAVHESIDHVTIEGQVLVAISLTGDVLLVNIAQIKQAELK